MTMAKGRPCPKRLHPRAPIFTGARVEVPAQLSGVLTLTMQRFPRRPMALCGLAFVGLKHPVGRLPG